MCWGAGGIHLYVTLWLRQKVLHLSVSGRFSVLRRSPDDYWLVNWLIGIWLTVSQQHHHSSLHTPHLFHRLTELLIVILYKIHILSAGNIGMGYLCKVHLDRIHPCQHFEMNNETLLLRTTHPNLDTGKDSFLSTAGCILSFYLDSLLLFSNPFQWFLPLFSNNATCHTMLAHIVVMMEPQENSHTGTVITTKNKKEPLTMKTENGFICLFSFNCETLLT